jgi:hypothetical protein
MKKLIYKKLGTCMKIMYLTGTPSIILVSYHFFLFCIFLLRQTILSYIFCLLLCMSYVDSVSGQGEYS